MALLHVVQQVLDALRATFAFGFNGFLLRFGVQCQKVAGRRGGRPLLHGKLNARLGFGIRFSRIGQRHHGAGVQ